ncbi:hypothetical protein GSI_11963 [Ganoderma sinense ZZ0214-1]|uniref:Uncharacterized protein n=1 Tax=Ganoderma sinense ZZ0214-1 TaxID=1077348 RepID=A0A2G8RY12_9APHY|nr:hypothetical protein GSI_11963 [Ganoderma sinense ZZ0214-1]
MDNPPSDFIDSPEKLQVALSYWKNRTFSQHYLKLEDVVASFDTPEHRLVTARQEFAPRWVLCRPGAKKPATFWTAGIWRWNSHLETGNYVPPGEVAPARLAEGRIQRVPNNLCQFSYGIDTSHDDSLWKAQAKFEDYIVKVNGFNPHQKDRREWQNGAGNQHSFVFSSQMFVKRTSYTRAKEASRSYSLHPWVAGATKKGTEFFANHERPEMFEPDAAGGLRPLSECYPPSLKLGDLVWLSFSAEFFIGGKYWSTSFVPYEFVRVGTVALDLLPEIRKEFDPDDVEVPRERLGAGMRVEDAHQLDADGDPLPGPTDAQQGPVVQPPATVTETAPNEYTFQPDDPERLRRLLRENDLLRPRTPPLLLDSEADGYTETTNGDETDEDVFADAKDREDDDDDDDDTSTTQDSMLVDDEGSVGDDDSFIVDDEASVMDDDTSVVDDAASVVAQYGSEDVDDKPQREADKKSAITPKSVPKPRGRKRAASTERPRTDEGVVVGTRILPDRRAKGKGVAR